MGRDRSPLKEVSLPRWTFHFSAPVSPLRETDLLGKRGLEGDGYRGIGASVAPKRKGDRGPGEDRDVSGGFPEIWFTNLFHIKGASRLKGRLTSSGEKKNKRREKEKKEKRRRRNPKAGGLLIGPVGSVHHRNSIPEKSNKVKKGGT